MTDLGEEHFFSVCGLLFDTSEINGGSVVVLVKRGFCPVTRVIKLEIQPGT